MNSSLRVAKVTSSDIFSLTSWGDRKMTEDELRIHKEEFPGSKKTTTKDVGAPFYTYVEKKRRERFYRRKGDTRVETFPMQWGKLCELYVHFVELSERGIMEYVYQTDVVSSDGGASTLTHPEIPEWVGTPDEDNKEEKVVADIKCPQSDLTHYDLISSLYNIEDQSKTNIDGNEAIKLIRENAKDGEKFYWQLVSNACIMGYDKAELIVYLPKLSSIFNIKRFNDGEDSRYPLAVPFDRIKWKDEDEIFHLPDESLIDELNFIRFDIPQEDKDFLTERVKKAIELINA